MRRVTFLIAPLVVLVCGCSAAPQVPRDVAQPRQDCVNEPTRPITAAELIGSLRSHGFSVRPIPGDAICDVPVSERMPVSVGNDESSEREGHVFCDLRRAPIWGWKLEEDLDAPPSSPIFSGDKATFSFANLECTLYPRGEGRPGQVRRLQAVVRELAAVARAKRASSR